MSAVSGLPKRSALLALILAAGALAAGTLFTPNLFGTPPQLPHGPEAPALPKLLYGIEWRLIRAGTAAIEVSPTQGNLKLDSAGLVSTLYKVDDTYAARFENGCTAGASLDAKEGRRYRRSELTVDPRHNRSSFVEKDVLKDTILRSVQLTVPVCVHDVLGAIWGLRNLNIAPGQSAQVPITDGRKAAQVKVEAQEREPVSTPAGTFQAIRYEAGIMNGVIYGRGGRVFIWLSDDARKIPVQIRLRMAFPAGTVTLQLEKGVAP